MEKKRYLVLVVSVFAVLACQRKPDEVEIYGLGCSEPLAEVSYEAGSHLFPVSANGPYSAESGAEWLTVEDVSGDGIVVGYGINRNFERSADVILTRGNNVVKLTLVQSGLLSSGVSVRQRNIRVPSSGGETGAMVITSATDESFEYPVSYEGASSPWIRNVRLENNWLRMVVDENYSGAMRYARVDLCCGSVVMGSVYVAQESSDVVFETTTLSQLKTMAGSSHIVFDRHYCIRACVLSDNMEGNGAENSNLSAQIQDLDAASRTVYVSGEDGTEGLRIDFLSSSDNAVSRYDRVEIDVFGCHLVCLQDPVRYVLEGVGSSNILSSYAGEPLPSKIRRIGELTDADVYTLVTLEDVQIPIRKGPFMPIDMRQHAVVNKCPMPLMDADGGLLPMLVNTTASWSRNGSMLPAGSGDVTGVIVNECCDNYEWDTSLAAEMAAAGYSEDYITGIGKLSRYQIRPVRRAEIALADKLEDGPTDMLCEFRWFNTESPEITVNARPGEIQATYPSLESGLLYCEKNGVEVPLAQKRDWTHLGPVSSWAVTESGSGNGVFDYSGNSCVFRPYTSGTGLSAGIVEYYNGSAWYATGWSTAQYWCCEFSTAGLSSANAPMSVHFGTLNGSGSTIGAPRYWAVEWSADKVEWIRVSEYTVPDFPLTALVRVWQYPGFKYVSATIPAEADIWGQEKVFIRLVPASSKAGTVESYDSGTISTGRDNSLNYFAVRYVK